MTDSSNFESAMTPDQYVTDRIESQIRWYSEKSQWNQRWFKRMRIVEMVFATSIPFLVGHITPETSWLKIVVGLLGVCVALISTLVSLYKFQENWIEYRTTAEGLKHEKYLFLTQSPPYDSADGFQAMVGRIESLISKENSAWARNTTKNAKVSDAASRLRR